MIELLRHALTCVTVVFCLLWFLRWVREMAQEQLPHFTVGVLQPRQPESPANDTPHIVGFAVDDEKELSDVEQRTQIMKDAASSISSLLRGELDFDEFGK